MAGLFTDHGLAFTTRTGTPVIRQDLITRSFKPLLARAGLPGIRSHDLCARTLRPCHDLYNPRYLLSCAARHGRCSRRGDGRSPGGAPGPLYQPVSSRSISPAKQRKSGERVGFQPTRRFFTAYAISSRKAAFLILSVPSENPAYLRLYWRSQHPLFPAPFGCVLPALLHGCCTR